MLPRFSVLISSLTIAGPKIETQAQPSTAGTA
jgi:hypothetical protein